MARRTTLGIADESYGFPLGMNDSAVATAFRPGECARAINFRIAPDDMLEVRSGSKRIHASALNGGGVGYGGAVFHGPDTTTGEMYTILLAAVGDRLYEFRVAGGSVADFAEIEPTEVSYGLNPHVEDYWSFGSFLLNGLPILVGANGDNNGVFYWRPVNASASFQLEPLPNSPAGAKFIAPFNDRIYAAGHDGPYVAACAIAEPDVWANPDGLAFPVLQRDGRELTGLWTLGDHLIVGKRSSLSRVDGYGNATLIVAQGARGVSGSIGCIAFRSFVSVSSHEAYFLSDRGIERLFGGQITLVSQRLGRLFRRVSWDAIHSNPGIVSAIFDPLRQEYRVALPVGSGLPNVEVVLNTRTGGMTVFIHGEEATGETFAVHGDQHVQVQEDTGGYTAQTFGRSLVLGEPFWLGPFVGVDADGYESEIITAGWPATLFSVDTQAQGQEPFMVDGQGFVKRLEVGDSDDATFDAEGTDISAVLVGAPGFAGDAFARQEPRRIHALIDAPLGGEVTLYENVDGVEGAAHVRSVTATTDSMPREVSARVGAARGITGRPVLRTTTPRLRVAGVQVTNDAEAQRP